MKYFSTYIPIIQDLCSSLQEFYHLKNYPKIKNSKIQSMQYYQLDIIENLIKLIEILDTDNNLLKDVIFTILRDSNLLEIL